MKLTELAYFTPDVQAMAAFYQNLLGTSPVAESEGMAIFFNNGVKIFIHRTYSPEEGELPPENHIAFSVPDVNTACLELTANGLAIEEAPREYYWGMSAYLRDPDGHLIELIEEQTDESGD